MDLLEFKLARWLSFRAEGRLALYVLMAVVVTAAIVLVVISRNFPI